MAPSTEALAMISPPLPSSSIEALTRLLDELAEALLTVDVAVYCARLESKVSGTIGEHVRHCLDHVAALLTADPAVPLSYDRRERGTAVETNPGAALHQILRLKAMLARWHDRALDAPICVTSIVAAQREAVVSWSTLARELVFVLSHTVHHQALIALLLLLHGVSVPDGFGYAPSTPREQ
jgi:hypothetical protein